MAIPITRRRIVVKIRYHIKYSEDERYFNTLILMRKFRNIIQATSIDIPIILIFVIENSSNQRMVL